MDEFLLTPNLLGIKIFNLDGQLLFAHGKEAFFAKKTFIEYLTKISQIFSLGKRKEALFYTNLHNYSIHFMGEYTIWTIFSTDMLFSNFQLINRNIQLINIDEFLSKNQNSTNNEQSSNEAQIQQIEETTLSNSDLLYDDLNDSIVKQDLNINKYLDLLSKDSSQEAIIRIRNIISSIISGRGVDIDYIRLISKDKKNSLSIRWIASLLGVCLLIQTDDRVKSILFSTQLVRFASEIKNNTIYATSLLMQSNASFISRLTNQAIEQVDQAIDLFESLGNQEALSKSLLTKSIILDWIGDYPKSYLVITRYISISGINFEALSLLAKYSIKNNDYSKVSCFLNEQNFHLGCKTQIILSLLTKVDKLDTLSIVKFINCLNEPINKNLLTKLNELSDDAKKDINVQIYSAWCMVVCGLKEKLKHFIQQIEEDTPEYLKTIESFICSYVEGNSNIGKNYNSSFFSFIPPYEKSAYSPKAYLETDDPMLSGELSMFPIADLLEFLSVQKHTGVLSLSYNNKGIFIFLKGGSICFVDSSAESLIKFIVKYASVPLNVLFHVLETFKFDSSGQLFFYLSESSILNENHMQKLIEAQVIHVMKEIVSITTTQFNFFSSSMKNKFIDIDISFNTQRILLELYRQIDEENQE